MKKVFVVGGGAAGLMAALSSAMSGNDVTIFEKNDRLGRKLLITGKGRCNLTNIATDNDFMDNIPGNSKFIFSAFNKFSNLDLINFLNNNGLRTKVERGGRVFPESDKALDVLNFFIKMLGRYNVKINYNSEVKDIITKENKISGILIHNELKYCDSVILATGGLSYPVTGSTGDGYDFAKKLGHTIIDLKPSLVPLVTYENTKELMGLSLKNINAGIYYKNKLIKEEFGELLFTHFGLSGPIILTLSRYIKDYVGKELLIKIDLKPALSNDKLDNRLLRDFEKYSKRVLKNSLDDLLPQTLIPYIIKISEIDPEKKTSKITKEERKKLIQHLKRLTFKIKGTLPIEEAIITSGGIFTKEINPSTMESKIIKGLFFAGEIIDVDGLTGGFNLQIAFSTGYVAGLNS
ncbi:NAD(P)/FAD-dependent oxidoreductase [Aceticella autotrophica]|uniref:NAD(P)/FAD-dependent oxidoreductase n=1 Tax=Aceticella autotrophica TaxID=2755338 RepID=A0A974Y2H2_9THEO|nr:NAD(P)/FAD-dependent oxidoreductase [Aceticella autotrophica]QSZ26404.1 NAD(P)/FAD-dependent oxidoreductase [Aceticella autotrophica]